MPLSFFAPHHAYSCNPEVCQQQNEFRELVRQLHLAGLEVILDVVYNHTCEGDESGPTYSYKGIDSSTYYLLTGDPVHPYRNDSGTGNTLHTANRAVRQLIGDSLQYWVQELHVDGFRFDLASIFTRGESGEATPSDPPIFGQIAANVELAKVRLIAEPWDAAGAYQLGSRFPGQLWMQWNARYRDTLQRFVRGDLGIVPELMTRLYGSSDLFPDRCLEACRPWQSINYVTSHDGSTLYDLTAYNEKHNEANGHDNADGAQEYRWNCGQEGEHDLPADVLQRRKQQVKNFFCLLMLSAGTPMFRMGDEFLQTQQGNNNPFNQDNATTWLDWGRLEEHRDLFDFFQQMIAFRKAHPSLGRPHFWRDDIRWYGPRGPVDLAWQSQTLAYCLRGGEVEGGSLYGMINGSAQEVDFHFGEKPTSPWRLAIDTTRPGAGPLTDGPLPVATVDWSVPARGVVVFVSEGERAAGA
jgi:glycogen operon protein